MAIIVVDGGSRCRVAAVAGRFAPFGVRLGERAGAGRPAAMPPRVKLEAACETQGGV